MIDDYGGKPLENFPAAETPKWAEWEVAAVLNGKGNSYSEIKAWAMNHTAWPARVAKDIEYRYYFDASEIFDAGLTINDIKVTSNSQQYKEGEQGYGTVSGPYVYEGDKSGKTLYAKVKFEDGRAIMPTGQSEHRDEVQFRISIPDAVDGKSTAGAWDPTNDWSYKGGLATATDIKSDAALNEHITMYVEGVHVWGTEPDGTKATKSDYVFKRGGGISDPIITAPKVTVTAGTSSAALSWTAVSGAESYGVVEYVDGTWKNIAEVTSGTSYTVKNLAAGSTHKYAVIVKANGKWNKDYSNAVSVTVKGSSTTGKYPVVTSEVQGKQFRLKWTAVSGATAYGVACYQNGGWRVKAQTKGNVLTYTSPKGVKSGKYQIVVCAKVNGKWDTSSLSSRKFTVTIKSST
jgi:hypothetical protein